jgi:hypothetical protein
VEDIKRTATRELLALHANEITNRFQQFYERGTFPGLKWPGREADHSPLSNAELKNGGAILSLPHMSSWHTA